MDLDGGKRVFNRLGPVQQQSDNRNQKVCYRWRAGTCNRFPCPYLHRELPAPTNGMASSKRPYGFATDDQRSRREGGGGANFNNSATWGLANNGCGGRGGNFNSNTNRGVVKKTEKICNFWCAGVINLGGEVGCMLSKGPWIFVGLPNLVKAGNAQTSADLSLDAPVEQVYALVVGNDLLLAGTQDGSILAWKYNAVTNCFDPAASLKGHTSAVVTLVVGANRLYPGSMDYSIRVWNLANLLCIRTLTEHTSVVMSVLSWGRFLLSCSLDKTIKVWAATDGGNLEVMYTHNEEHGLLTLCGMHDLESKPVLLCSCNDNSACAYDLPSFSERGKIFSKQEIRSIHVGPNIFFTGDGTGEVRVWHWLADQTNKPA